MTMSEITLRRLFAILIADRMSYSRLMVVVKVGAWVRPPLEEQPQDKSALIRVD